MWKNAPFLAIVAFDTAENELRKEWCVVANRSISGFSINFTPLKFLKLASPPSQSVPNSSKPWGTAPRAGRPRHRDRSLEGSFSAGSTATIATKYSFFQVFRDLQNYLAKFSKILQNFVKNQRFSQKSALFLRKSGNFAKVLQNSAIFCKICKFYKNVKFSKISSLILEILKIAAKCVFGCKNFVSI